MSAPEREIRCRRPRGTLTATCAILTAATIRFDNYSDADGRERQCIFMGSNIGQERSGGGRRDGEERRAPAGGSLSANASPPSRTHSWLSINIVVDSTLARSFIELSFRSNGQIAWVGSVSLSLSLSLFSLLSLSLSPLPFSHGICLFYKREHRWCYLWRALPPLYNRITRRDCERSYMQVRHTETARQPGDPGERRSSFNSPRRTRTVWASAAALPSGRSCPIDCIVLRRSVCAAALWFRQRSSLCRWRLAAPRPTTFRSSSPWSTGSGRSTPLISASSAVLEHCLQKSGVEIGEGFR